jgi:hypothetical protein
MYVYYCRRSCASVASFFGWMNGQCPGTRFTHDTCMKVIVLILFIITLHLSCETI